ncbi:MAG: hypothetical protein R3E79_47135 [Caldilineaceae bacterium]
MFTKRIAIKGLLRPLLVVAVILVFLVAQDEKPAQAGQCYGAHEMGHWINWDTEAPRFAIDFGICDYASARGDFTVYVHCKKSARGCPLKMDGLYWYDFEDRVAVAWKQLDNELIKAWLYFEDIRPYRGGKMTVVWKSYRENGRPRDPLTEQYWRK